MLTPGTLVTVDVSGQTKGSLPKGDLLADVVRELSLIPLTVKSSRIDAANPIYNLATFQWFHYAYSASVTVSVPAESFDNADAVSRAVQNAFEDIATAPLTAIQARIVGTVPAIVVPADLPSLPNLSTTLFVIVGLLVLVIVAIGWAPNPGRLAGALRP